MSIAHARKNKNTVQTKRESSVSILDSSSQSEALQRKADMANNATQRAEAPRPNNTGMPDNLKSGIESLSGFSMDDVRVHYNSSKPATVQALAYTQGTDIHVAPGQEKHLPHEAWHVAQQMAGRVSPTTNINGMPVNDNAGLEQEADVMGEKAVQRNKENRLLKHKVNKEKISAQRIVENVDLESDEVKKEILMNAYSESHEGRSYGDALKSQISKTAKVNDYIKPENFSTEKQEKEIYHYCCFFYRMLDTYVSNSDLKLSSKDDIEHQMAQDYLLSTTLAEYSTLIGQDNSFLNFHFDTQLGTHSSKSFEMALKEDARAKIEPKDTEKQKQEKRQWLSDRIKKLHYDKLVIYRNFDLTTISNNTRNTEIQLFGGAHGGALGTALVYSEQRKSSNKDIAIAKVSINDVDIKNYIIGSGGEGDDAKTEKASELPLSGVHDGKNYNQFSLSFAANRKLHDDYSKKQGDFEVIYSHVHSNKTYKITDGTKSYVIKPDLNGQPNYECELNFNTENEAILKAHGRRIVKWYNKIKETNNIRTVGTQGEDFVIALHNYCKANKIRLKESDMKTLLAEGYDKETKKIVCDFTSLH